MDAIEESLFVTWVSRLGAARVRELNRDSTARNTRERAVAIVRGSSRDDLDELLLEGFRGRFHQTVFRRINTPARNSERLASLRRANTTSDVTVRSVVRLGARNTLALLLVSQVIEFLPASGAPIRQKVPLPVLVETRGTRLIVYVITMQSSSSTWTEIIGKVVRRLLTTPNPDACLDTARAFLEDRDIATGDYEDFSEYARELIDQDEVDTYSGSYDVETVGRTRHETIGARRKRRPLRRAMPAQFRRLAAAERINKLEVQFADDHAGLKRDSKLLLYPTAGKLVCRARLDGSDLHGFVASID